MSGSALSAQQGINFGGTIGVKQFCQIVLVEDGVLAQSSDQQQLSSKEVGGAAGRLQITTTSGKYKVSIDTPAGFTAMPAGGGADVTYLSDYSLTGATAAAETSGATETKLKRGLTDMRAHFTANRLTDPFPAGTYSSVLTVRCE
ncbi:MAG: hypothetical protein GKR97_19200 [Rhizobiaceae bacterium]|nr:hypothetical protein [Rhizobiaceae bacterium]